MMQSCARRRNSVLWSVSTSGCQPAIGTCRASPKCCTPASSIWCKHCIFLGRHSLGHGHGRIWRWGSSWLHDICDCKLHCHICCPMCCHREAALLHHLLELQFHFLHIGLTGSQSQHNSATWVGSGMFWVFTCLPLLCRAASKRADGDRQICVECDTMSDGLAGRHYGPRPSITCHCFSSCCCACR